MLENSKM